MTDFDAIVVGAGHNGLTAAALLQKAGLRTLCLESKLYAGGMASTVELFDGFKFEIAGSVQIPTSATVSRELGLDDLPTVDLDVMSVSLRGIGDEPLVYYTDPMKLLAHINEVHGAEAVNGMAGLMAWCQAPTRALGRFDAGQPPKTLDEMYACATNEFERSTITDLLFGSVTDVLDRYLPDKEKNGALRGMLSLLACNTTYRGPATPAPRRPWRTASPSRTRMRCWSRSCAAASGRSHRTCTSCSPRTAASCGCAARSTRSWSPTAGSPASASRTARCSPHRSSSPVSHRI
jgi:phytoene dehydrogenase-like protein